MTALLAAVAAALVVGLVGAAGTLRVARSSVRWATILGPVTVVLAVGAGLLVGTSKMLIGDARVVLLILGAVLPVALLMGVFVSVRSNRIMTDVRTRLDGERRRREIEEGRLELITWLSHDLRTPLAGIRAMAEALIDGVASDPQAYHRAIVVDADRTTTMVNDLMALASLKSKLPSRTTETVVMADLVSDLLGQLRPLAHSRGMELVGELNTTPSDVNGDTSLLTRAVQNVVVNAINYSTPGTRVNLALDSAAGWVVVSVTDGCGRLEPDTLAHMFEAGWRGDTARTPNASAGSGLGLAIVKAVVEAHSGRVQVNNTVDGCTMVLQLPAA